VVVTIASFDAQSFKHEPIIWQDAMKKDAYTKVDAKGERTR